MSETAIREQLRTFHGRGATGAITRKTHVLVQLLGYTDPDVTRTVDGPQWSMELIDVSDYVEGCS